MNIFNYKILNNTTFYENDFLVNFNKIINNKKNTVTTNIFNNSVSNNEKATHKTRMIENYIIPLCYLVYSFIYTKFYRIQITKEIVDDNDVKFKMLNYVFYHENPIIKKANIFFHKIFMENKQNNPNKQNKKIDNPLPDINNTDTIAFLNAIIEEYNKEDKCINIIESSTSVTSVTSATSATSATLPTSTTSTNITIQNNTKGKFEIFETIYKNINDCIKNVYMILYYLDKSTIISSANIKSMKNSKFNTTNTIKDQIISQKDDIDISNLISMLNWDNENLLINLILDNKKAYESLSISNKKFFISAMDFYIKFSENINKINKEQFKLILDTYLVNESVIKLKNIKKYYDYFMIKYDTEKKIYNNTKNNKKYINEIIKELKNQAMNNNMELNTYDIVKTNILINTNILNFLEIDLTYLKSYEKSIEDYNDTMKNYSKSNSDKITAKQKINIEFKNYIEKYNVEINQKQNYIVKLNNYDINDIVKIMLIILYIYKSYEINYLYKDAEISKYFKKDYLTNFKNIFKNIYTKLYNSFKFDNEKYSKNIKYYKIENSQNFSKYEIKSSTATGPTATGPTAKSQPISIEEYTSFKEKFIATDQSKYDDMLSIVQNINNNTNDNFIINDLIIRQFLRITSKKPTKLDFIDSDKYSIYEILLNIFEIKDLSTLSNLFNDLYDKYDNKSYVGTFISRDKYTTTNYKTFITEAKDAGFGVTITPSGYNPIFTNDTQRKEAANALTAILPGTRPGPGDLVKYNAIKFFLLSPNFTKKEKYNALITYLKNYQRDGVSLSSKKTDKELNEKVRSINIICLNNLSNLSNNSSEFINYITESPFTKTNLVLYTTPNLPPNFFSSINIPTPSRIFIYDKDNLEKYMNSIKKSIDDIIKLINEKIISEEKTIVNTRTKEFFKVNINRIIQNVTNNINNTNKIIDKICIHYEKPNTSLRINDNIKLLYNNCDTDYIIKIDKYRKELDLSRYSKDNLLLYYFKINNLSDFEKFDITSKKLLDSDEISTFMKKSKFTYFDENLNNIIHKNSDDPDNKLKYFFDIYENKYYNVFKTKINELCDYIKINNIKYESIYEKKYGEIVNDLDKKIQFINDNADANAKIKQKNSKFITILPYTDVLHMYLIYLLKVINYLTFFYIIPSINT